MYDVGLADRIWARGVEVVEIAGWQTRGSATFNPQGSVHHHTASGPSGVAPSLAICTYGRRDLAGPLCNVLQGRDDVAYVIAAGRANHAGRGGWKGLTGNSSVYGLEVEHTGHGAVPRRRHEISIQIHAAFAEGPTMPGDAGLVCQHSEWAPTRKVDFRELAPWTPDLFRVGVAEALAPSPQPPATEVNMRLLHPHDTPGDSGGIWLQLGDNVGLVKNPTALADLQKLSNVPLERIGKAGWADIKRIAALDSAKVDVNVASAKAVVDEFNRRLAK